MVKGIAIGGGKVTVKNFLNGYMDAMADHKVTVQSSPSDSDTEQVINHIRSILDISASPKRIIAACHAFDKGSPLVDHWLMKAFALEKGRKLIDSALDSANKPKDLCGVLEDVEEAQNAFQALDLLEVESSLVEGGESKFTEQYGKDIAKAHRLVTSEPWFVTSKGVIGVFIQLQTTDYNIIMFMLHMI